MLVGALLRRSVASATTVATIFTAVFTASLVGSPTVATAAGFSCSADVPSYTVRAGDGWFAIAELVDVSARALLEANSAAVDDVIVPGDVLCLPPGADIAAACRVSSTVRSGDGWFVIADRVDVSVRALLAANGAGLGRTIHPGDAVCLPDGANPGAVGSSVAARTGGASYTVTRGDSWYGIAERADVAAGELLSVNGASFGDLIVPGDVIQLPAGATRPAPSGSNQRQWVDLEALPAQGPCGYADTWRAARGGGRRHAGVDIFSKAGDYVYAVVDGRLTGRNWDQRDQISGNTWTLTAADGTFYFYAHLSDFNPALSVGSRVKAGEIIGWVGATGNASAPHLHFEIHPGGGAAINPYPILRAEGGCNNGTPYTQPSGWVPDRIR